MANECKVTWSISVDKEPPMNAPTTDNIFNQLGSISTGDFIKGSVTASHTADTVVPLGATSGNCRYFSFSNPSQTETVQLKVGSGGVAFAELAPGFSSGIIPVPAGSTPYARALGSIDVDIAYTMFAR